MGKAAVKESTITANVAWTGGGVYDVQGSTTTVTNATIFQNVSWPQSVASGPFDSNPHGANVYVESGGTFSVVNTIMASPGASGASDVYGTIQSLGHNMIFTPDEGSGYAPSDILRLDPQLLSLADNGGPTQTCMPATRSFAIDGGDNSYVQDSYDQRGYTRIQDGTVDIGAVETPYSPPSVASPGVAASIRINDLAHASIGGSGFATLQESATTQESATASSPTLDLALPKLITQLHGKPRVEDNWTGL